MKRNVTDNTSNATRKENFAATNVPTTKGTYSMAHAPCSFGNLKLVRILIVKSEFFSVSATPPILFPVQSPGAHTSRKRQRPVRSQLYGSLPSTTPFLLHRAVRLRV